MHIPDGILPAAVCVGGYATTALATGLSLRQFKPDSVPKASIFTAAFFVASWIHIPIPPTSVHLVLNGLLGVVLGPMAFPAILIGLFFQAVMFQHGGLTTLGVNATMMGLPAILAYYLFKLRSFGSRESRVWTGVLGFLGGGGAIGLSAVMSLVLLINTIPAHLDPEIERASIYTLTLAHVPLIAIEGLLTALVVVFLQRVRPELLENQ
jgi:cobalt/nickel transport system permease protein